jgi:hypothetical protein
MTFGDFNNDRFEDLVVPGAVLLGNGDGTFRTRLLSSPLGLSVVAGYFNDDGMLDIAHCTSSGFPFFDGTIRVQLGNGDGTFRSPISKLTSGGRSLAVGYFNRDAIADLAVTDDFYQLETGPTVTILLGNGDGTFQSASNAGLVDQGPLVVDDFDGDAVADLAQLGYTRVSVALGERRRVVPSTDHWQCCTRRFLFRVGFSDRCG